MIMAQPELEAPQHVGHVPEDALKRWLPVDTIVSVSPVWLCDTFEDLREGEASTTEGTKLRGVLHELSDRAAQRVERLHAGDADAAAESAGATEGGGGATEGGGGAAAAAASAPTTRVHVARLSSEEFSSAWNNERE